MTRLARYDNIEEIPKNFSWQEQMFTATAVYTNGMKSRGIMINALDIRRQKFIEELRMLVHSEKLIKELEEIIRLERIQAVREIGEDCD